MPAIRPLLLLVLLVLGGCGFQLRGQAELPPELSRIFIQTSNPTRVTISPLGRALGSSLAANGVSVVDSPEQADAVLRILDENLNRRTLATGPDGSTREYALNYSVAYSLVGADDQVLLEPNRLTLTRDVLYDEADVLGRSEGEDIVLNDMISDAAYSIIRRLQSLSVRG